jgi:hypothetical protein
VARLGATILLSGFLGTVAITVATATDDPPPTTPTVRAPAPGGHHRVRWQLYLREHRATTRLGRKVRTLRSRLRALQQELERARHVQTVAAASQPAHYSAWLCIHRYEGAWDANTGNGYYGGLQMDIEFQQAYGPELLQAKGTADHWTPLEQMQVAERAYQSGRGFYPWPNTARMCGLL